MDVISLHQAGFTNAVASLGTALTAGHASLIKRYVSEVYLTYDSDEAGTKAALRAVPILKEAGISAKVIRMDPYKDPDEFIKNLGAEAFEQRIGKASRASYQILIAHNPSHVPAYKEWKADLVVSGHFHGGLVRLPFLGAVITPQLKIFPRYSGGIYREGQTTTVVSRGIGEHTIPVRLFNTPEVVVLHMKGRQ